MEFMVTSLTMDSRSHAVFSCNCYHRGKCHVSKCIGKGSSYNHYKKI